MSIVYIDKNGLTKIINPLLTSILSRSHYIEILFSVSQHRISVSLSNSRDHICFGISRSHVRVRYHQILIWTAQIYHLWSMDICSWVSYEWIVLIFLFSGVHLVETRSHDYDSTSRGYLRAMTRASLWWAPSGITSSWASYGSHARHYSARGMSSSTCRTWEIQYSQVPYRALLFLRSISSSSYTPRACVCSERIWLCSCRFGGRDSWGSIRIIFGDTEVYSVFFLNMLFEFYYPNLR